ncbi:MAG: hypothetical protein IPJ58_02130 [Ardenticatenia bacterium]|nr:hypothetical protein [Ardenticatenia bacterium]
MYEVVTDLPGERYLAVLPQSEYIHWSKRFAVLGASTWGELRTGVDSEVFAEVLGLAGYGDFEEYAAHLEITGAVPLPGVTEAALEDYGEVGEDLPTDDAPFNAYDDLPACADGDWPPSLFYLMSGTLPEAVLDAFADRTMTLFNGEAARIPEEVSDDALAALRGLGFQLVHEPGLQDFLQP